MSRRNGVSTRREFGLYEEPLMTAGIRKLGSMGFVVAMKGRDWFACLQFFEEQAAAGGPYLKVRKAVVIAEEFRRQLEAQGWGNGKTPS